MPTIKQAALHAIENLPEDVDYDDIMEAIHVQQKIAKGIKELDGGKLVTHEQVKDRVKKRST
jgi:predicted transcriptional regulator